MTLQCEGGIWLPLDIIARKGVSDTEDFTMTSFSLLEISNGAEEAVGS